LCAILSTRPDLEVCAEAGDGQQAILKILETNPDLIILDVGMPHLEGLSVALKLQQFLPSIPIIILSIDDGPEIVSRTQQVGARASVREPGP
jgi:DNA-binding NarL/FixJ family response regulator